MLVSLESSSHSALLYNSYYTPEINNICSPLFENFGITFFSYSHFFNNGTYLDLSNFNLWQQHYIKNFATKSFVRNYISDIYHNNIRYTLWNNDPESAPSKVHRNFISDSCYFNLHHGFSIYKSHSHSLEAWHFATTRDNHKITDFYLNNLNILDSFIFYFKEKASKIIDYKYTSKLIVLEDRTSYLKQNKNCDIEENIKRYRHQTEHKKFYFHSSRTDICLSRRENECILYLCKAKTFKEIARILNISPRSVETYISNIKRKTGCRTRSELIETFLKYITNT